MRKYKLFIRKYNFIKNDYEVIEKIIETKDIYHEIGYIYCTTLEEIKRIDYVRLEERKIKMDNIEVKRMDLKLKEGHAVCFDFDGVIHKYSKGWQDGSIYDEYNKEVLDLMLLLQKLNIPVFICSTREPTQIKRWWDINIMSPIASIIPDYEKFWNNTEYIGITNKKLPAQLYIDDRAYKYTGQTVKEFLLENSEELEGE